jgi:hypothetical protein
MKAIVLVAALFAAQATWGAAAPAPVAIDHVWITVSPGAPERKALVEHGFSIARAENRHDGQGTASITVEFQNGYLELVWLDETVAVAPGMELAVDKFRRRMQWRTSGWAPIGVGLHRTAPTDEPLPWPVWKIPAASWLKEGTHMEMLTPREKGSAPSVFVEPRYLYVDERRNLEIIRAGGDAAVDFKHANGTRRLTAVKVFAPSAAALDGPPTQDLERMNVVRFATSKTWLLQLTLDDAAQGKRADLRPALPLVIEY